MNVRTGEVPRFRRRLTAAFVIVAAVAAGALALTTYTISAEYRTRSFESRSRDEAELALALAPAELSEPTFERLQAAYESRTGASTLARSRTGVFSSSPGLSASDIPAAVRDPAGAEIVTAKTTVDGVRRFVLASTRGGDSYWFFFSMEPVEESLSELRRVLAASWLMTAVGGALVGHIVARKTLLPVRAASEAARSLAAGLLETRLEAGSDDEFGTLTASFNEMAAALQHTIGRLEAAAAREKRFTADIAHELRTPLTSMAAAASLISDELPSLPPTSRRSVELVLADVRRLRELVLELLELARMDAGSEPLRVERLEVRPALEAVARSVVEARGLATNDIQIEVPTALAVDADRARMRRVLTNLIDNAVSHGAPPVVLTARDEGTRITIEVRDHGEGIAVADPSELFDRFTKSDRSRSEGGSGLGLAIAAGHAIAMGGSLEAADSVEGGAVFRFSVPAAAPGLPG